MSGSAEAEGGSSGGGRHDDRILGKYGKKFKSRGL